MRVGKGEKPDEEVGLDADYQDRSRESERKSCMLLQGTV